MAFKMKAGSGGPMKKNFPGAFKQDPSKKGWDGLTPEEQEEEIKYRKSPEFNEKIYKWDTLTKSGGRSRLTPKRSKGLIPKQGRKV